ncbi:hypothetical protein KM908_14515 [Alkalihalobacillus clausii]|uniref:hypothetical protein n=1 Tax=Shouchella clausii TaxID=79880 RepID=UPI001C214358|nr:hypothetical protein [Shouchella clausii]MBU8597356.1 hypothetical protein [Shouchella clausii]
MSYARIKTDVVEASVDGELAEIRCLETGKVDWYRLNVEPVEYRNVERWINSVIKSVQSITIEVSGDYFTIENNWASD